MCTNRSHVFAVVAALTSTICLAELCSSQQNGPLGVANWLTITANVPDAGYRRTQFFTRHFNTAVVEWDSRVELWFPPFRDKFSWGPYVRMSGIAGSQGSYAGIPASLCPTVCTDAWQNAWLGGPGLGIQVYPLSSWRFQGKDSKIGRLFGPLRLFAEYNFTDYWGQGNQWRPHNRARAGLEYWKATNVNTLEREWWAEIWNGLYWQSSNEFTDRYDSVVFANSVRFGIRKPKHGAISTITPYLTAESSRTKYDYAGTRCFLPANGAANPCDFYWENHLLAGGGIRFAPSLVRPSGENRSWLSRFVLYGEYLNTATYYGPPAPSFVARSDIVVGVSASIGQWYK
jgi:hypothetical protein